MGHVGSRVTYCIAVLETEVKVLDVKLEIGKDELSQNSKKRQTVQKDDRQLKTHLFSDLLPDDARHLIAIEFNDWILYHDLLF